MSAKCKSWISQGNLAGTRLFEPAPSVAAVVTKALGRTDSGFVGTNYTIYADQNCSSGLDACADGTTLHLGYDVLWQYKLAHNKSTVGHEIGHTIMHGLMGTPHYNYDDSAALSDWECLCDHVSTASKLHCIQSRETVGGAQVEGWGHFFANDVFNDGTQATATFAYYKEYAVTIWNTKAIVPPPVVFSSYYSYRQMDTYCPSTGRGTELDWLGFYSWVHAKGDANKYTYGDLNTLYRRACTGGTGQCNFSHAVTWAKLGTAVNALFGPAKRLHWTNTGANYGVNF